MWSVRFTERVNMYLQWPARKMGFRLLYNYQGWISMCEVSKLSLSRSSGSHQDCCNDGSGGLSVTGQGSNQRWCLPTCWGLWTLNSWADISVSQITLMDVYRTYASSQHASRLSLMSRESCNYIGPLELQCR
ncbi:hypothetical protein RRG08_020243 [Elysia crispata]|uniref:Uncharacterized protein n=1 Tax=Elysia crispata TaxID=231223 RepID=A0AAE1A2V0_9GAST|nr:hypothetical protein RRG08_020243 [Elysia crispata]